MKTLQPYDGERSKPIYYCKLKGTQPKQMKILRLLFLVSLTACLTCSCEDDDSDSEVRTFEVNELAGNWEATRAEIVRSDGAHVDILADEGAVSLIVKSNGRCTFTIDPAEREAYKMSGRMFWEQDDGEDVFAIEYDDYPGDFAYYGVSLTSTTFIMGWDGGSADPNGEYDFNNDGLMEDGIMDFSFVRE